MKRIYAQRASGILYNILRSMPKDKQFIVPANICPIVLITLQKADCNFELIDIEKPSLTIDKSECYKRVASEPNKYAGIIFVRTYGSDLDEDDFFCRIKMLHPNLTIIDDKCLCRPDLSGNNLSSHADITLFSTGYAKYADVGFGGYAFLQPHIDYSASWAHFDSGVLSEIEKTYKKALKGKAPFNNSMEAWLDLSEPSIAWPEYRQLVTTACVEADLRKQTLNDIYSQTFPREIKMQSTFQKWRFNILVDAPDQLLKEIFDNGLFASRHYCSVSGAFGAGNFPVVDSIYAKVINLFNDRYFDVYRAKELSKIILTHLHGLSP